MNASIDYREGWAAAVNALTKNIRPLPFQPFSKEPVKNPRGKLYGERESTGLACVMALLEEEISGAVGGQSGKTGEDLSRAAGATEALLDLYDVLKQCAAGEFASHAQKEGEDA